MINGDVAQGKNITSTTTFTCVSGGQLLGVFCSTSTSGTVKIADGSTTIVNTFTAVAATFYRIPLSFAGNLVVTIGGTFDGAVFFNPNA